jgi:hypothetical protein
MGEGTREGRGRARVRERSQGGRGGRERGGGRRERNPTRTWISVDQIAPGQAQSRCHAWMVKAMGSNGRASEKSMGVSAACFDPKADGITIVSNIMHRLRLHCH